MASFLSYNAHITLPGTRCGHHIAITPQGEVYRYHHASPLTEKSPRPSGLAVEANFSNLDFPIPSLSARGVAQAAAFPDILARRKALLDGWRFVARVCDRTIFLEDLKATLGAWIAPPSIKYKHVAFLTADETLNVLNAVNKLEADERPDAVWGCRYNPTLGVFVPN